MQTAKDAIQKPRTAYHAILWLRNLSPNFLKKTMKETLMLHSAVYEIRYADNVPLSKR